MSHEIWWSGVCAFELYHLQCFEGGTEVCKDPIELIIIIILIHGMLNMKNGHGGLGN